MARRGAQVRRRLVELVEAAEGADRYQDLALRLRAVRADFDQEVPIDHTFTAAGVECVTAAAGRLGVPVRSLEVGASTRIPDGTAFEGGTWRGEALLEAGGRWDTLRGRWAEDPPATWHTIDLIESQHQLVREFARWLARYRERRRRPVGRVRDVRTMIAYGNRGSGKTFVSLLLLLALGLAVPGGVYWIVVENRPAAARDVWQTFEDLQPGWCKYRGQPDYVWRLPNGSEIYYKSADEPSSLKAGRVDALLINEAAKLPREVYGYATARTKERGGITLLATNPPTPDKPRGIWIYRLYEREREARAKGEWFPAVSYQLNSDANALIDRGADEDVSLLIKTVAPTLAGADVLGEMAMPGERIIYAYDQVRHGLRAPPALGDVTEQVLRRHPRVGRPFRYLAGVDFQASFPYIVVVFFKLFGDVTKPILWAVSDASVKGNEDDFLDEVLQEGVITGEGEGEEIERDTVLWIGDSSAQQQNSRHDFTAPPSFPAFLNRGLRIMSPTSPTSEKAKYGRNPSVGVSLGQVNSLFKVDRIMVSPLAPRLAEDCREGVAKETERGLRPDRPHSHYLDCLRYVAWFLDPPTRRRKGSATGERRETCYAVE